MTAATVGFIYPDHAAEDDYPFAEQTLFSEEEVNVAVTHIYGTDLHAVPELLDLGKPERLADGAAQLAHQQPQAVVWACTSRAVSFTGHAGRPNKSKSSRRRPECPLRAQVSRS